MPDPERLKPTPDSLKLMPGSERLKLQKDILWGLYQEHRTHARHNETLRSTINNMLVVASVAIISFATYDKEVSRDDWPAAALLVGVGLLGLFFSASYTERVLKHKQRAKGCQKELDSIVFTEPFGRTLNAVLTIADFEHEKSPGGWIRKVTNTHLFWMMLPLVIIVAGIALTYVCFKDGGAAPEPTPEAAVRAADQQRLRAFAAGDVEKAVEFSTDDGSVLAPNAPAATGRDATARLFSGLFARPNLNVTRSPDKAGVAESGELGYTSGSYQMSFKDASGKSVSDRGKYVTVWKKQRGGGWKVLLDTFNSDLPPPPVSP